MITDSKIQWCWVMLLCLYNPSVVYGSDQPKQVKESYPTMFHTMGMVATDITTYIVMG